MNNIFLRSLFLLPLVFLSGCAGKKLACGFALKAEPAHIEIETRRFHEEKILGRVSVRNMGDSTMLYSNAQLLSTFQGVRTRPYVDSPASYLVDSFWGAPINAEDSAAYMVYWNVKRSVYACSDLHFEYQWADHPDPP